MAARTAVEKGVTMIACKRAAVALGLLAFVLAGPVLAQQGRHGRMGQMGMMGQMGQMEMMAGVSGFQPAALLERGEELSLTEEQRASLTGIRDEAAEARERAQADHDSYRTRLHEALMAAEPDVEQLRGLFQGAHGFMGLVRWADIEAAMKAKALLSDEQRSLVEATTPAPPGGQRPMRMMRR
jgi:hypothetical protein